MKRGKGLLSQYGGMRREMYILFFGRIVTNLGSMVYPMLTMILSQKLGLDAASISILMVAAMAPSGTRSRTPRPPLGGGIENQKLKMINRRQAPWMGCAGGFIMVSPSVRFVPTS